MAISGYAAITVNPNAKTLELTRLKPDWGDFKFKWRGFESQTVTFTVNSNDVAATLTCKLATFRLSQY